MDGVPLLPPSTQWQRSKTRERREKDRENVRSGVRGMNGARNNGCDYSRSYHDEKYGGSFTMTIIVDMKR